MELRSKEARKLVLLVDFNFIHLEIKMAIQNYGTSASRNLIRAAQAMLEHAQPITVLGDFGTTKEMPTNANRYISISEEHYLSVLVQLVQL